MHILLLFVLVSVAVLKNVVGEEGVGEEGEQRAAAISNLSFRQMEEFSLLGRLQLGQLRSQLDYDLVMRNYGLNIAFQLRKVGIITAQSRSDNNTKCFDGLGCIEISEKWYDLSRPINLLPLDREVVNTQFLLSTRDQLVATRLDLEDAQMVEDAGFKGDRPTKIIIHGFLDTGQEAWVKDMTSALLDAEDCNVIAIDWGGGSLPLYSQAAANTRLVGLEVANLIVVLVEEHQAYSGDFHIIGHSLGAHIAGYAGERIPGLGRISGLDPAELLFQGMPGFVRLDPTDANFVDVIHTDAESILMGGYGMEQPVGHVDFYPNGGEVQPGCSLLDLPDISSITVEELGASLPSADTVGRHLVACAHNRAVALYIDSIRSGTTCPMVGHKCASYADFQAGSCFYCGLDGEACASMGYLAKPHPAWRTAPLRMYLETGAVAPYCKHHYLLQLHLAKPRQAEAWVQGYLKVNLFGDKGKLTEYDLTPEESLRVQHGQMYDFSISVERNLGEVEIVQVHWLYDHEVDPFDLTKICFLFCSDRLYTDKLVLTTVKHSAKSVGGLEETSLSLCGEEKTGLGFSDIRSGTWKLFFKQCPHS